LRKQQNKSTLVFSRTKHGADKIARVLNKKGIECDAIHGNKSQGARQRALTNFKSGKTRVIIATDIAARGIDIANLEMVINYDLPDIAETYVHRIGRTGRAGKSGTALSFCTHDEHSMVKDIQKLTGKKLNTVLTA
jgi:ATP-dependent RNA helicase RhlE